ncbi:hypothetical protein TNIN_331501 [Trichonephila inaurata madagascariensis]|uniref:Uncharacterized protein n=1 Tax=Trichonephila inaurata madagascariensis TaxID=2747483 RepID=A0A8X6IQG4_9ARAC|nr:hypothetical protein TNIN_331501 [Trichonephila inaurata madagascariensis]
MKGGKDIFGKPCCERIILTDGASRGKEIFQSSAVIEFIFGEPCYSEKKGKASCLRKGKGKKQDMLQLAEELGINATSNMTVPSIKIAITNSEGYEEGFVKNLYETIIANRPA